MQQLDITVRQFSHILVGGPVTVFMQNPSQQDKQSWVVELQVAHPKAEQCIHANEPVTQ